MGLRASIERFLAPGWGRCYRCQRPWKFATSHTTHYSETRGCFPLCEPCWADLATPEARLPYYRALEANWRSNGYQAYDWPAIKAAVMEGK